MGEIINYQTLYNNLSDKVAIQGEWLSDKENKQYKLLHRWYIRDNFTDDRLEELRLELEMVSD